MLTDVKIDRMRTTVARSFIDTIVVQRQGGGADSDGNPVRSLTAQPAIDGRWATPTAGELEVAAQSGQQLDAVLTVAYDEDIRPGDLADVTDHGRWRVSTVTVGNIETKVGLIRVDL